MQTEKKKERDALHSQRDFFWDEKKCEEKCNQKLSLWASWKMNVQMLQTSSQEPFLLEYYNRSIILAFVLGEMRWDSRKSSLVISWLLSLLFFEWKSSPWYIFAQGNGSMLFMYIILILIIPRKRIYRQICCGDNILVEFHEWEKAHCIFQDEKKKVVMLNLQTNLILSFKQLGSMWWHVPRTSESTVAILNMRALLQSQL